MNTRRNRNLIICATIFVVVLFLVMGVFHDRDAKKEIYDEAINLYKNEKYPEAAEVFNRLGLYEDSLSYLMNSRNYIKYNEGIDFYNEGRFEDAWENFSALGDFAESKIKAKESRYAYAQQVYSEGNLELAFSIFQELGDYEDSLLMVANITLELKNEMEDRIYNAALQYYKLADYTSALKELSKIEDYEGSAQLKAKCEDELARKRLGHTFAAGVNGSVAIKEDGSLIYTGGNMALQLAAFEGNNLVSIDCFGLVSIGLTKDGKVITSEVSNINAENWEDIIAVSAGRAYVVGLKNNGTVEADGHNGDGQCDVSEWRNIVSIATGWRHTVGLTEDGFVKIAGYTGGNSHRKRVESWSDIIAIAAGGGHAGDAHSGHTVGLTKDNRVVAAGDNTYGQCEVDDWKDIVAIAAGDWHTVGLKADGTVVAVGYKADEGYARDTLDDPCFVSDWKTDDEDKRVIAIAANRGYTLGLTADGRILATGFTAQDQRPDSGEWNDILRYSEWYSTKN